jgi:hypothetical protein
VTVPEDDSDPAQVEARRRILSDGGLLTPEELDVIRVRLAGMAGQQLPQQLP